MLNGEQFPEEQLSMFIPAGEIKEHYYPIDYSPGFGGDTPVQRKLFWRGKLQESKFPTSYQPMSTYESIKREGVKRPVQIYLDPEKGRSLGQGHHRVASQAALDPDRLVPVKFTDEWGEALNEDDTEYLAHIKKLADDI